MPHSFSLLMRCSLESGSSPRKPKTARPVGYVSACTRVSMKSRSAKTVSSARGLAT
uniref:Uncharacterized protein n=1 Tax=Hyaloperonospora arabidopsidis (strain Emoy2) TaxID=559515 RepID=M4BVT0_HYAAE